MMLFFEGVVTNILSSHSLESLRDPAGRSGEECVHLLGSGSIHIGSNVRALQCRNQWSGHCFVLLYGFCSAGLGGVCLSSLVFKLFPSRTGEGDLQVRLFLSCSPLGLVGWTYRRIFILPLNYDDFDPLGWMSSRTCSVWSWCSSPVQTHLHT